MISLTYIQIIRSCIARILEVFIIAYIAPQLHVPVVHSNAPMESVSNGQALVTQKMIVKTIVMKKDAALSLSLSYKIARYLDFLVVSKKFESQSNSQCINIS